MKELSQAGVVYRRFKSGRPFMLAVETMEQGCMEGELYHFSTGCTTHFVGLSDAVLALEKRMDEQDAPDLPGELRSFSCRDKAFFETGEAGTDGEGLETERKAENKKGAGRLWVPGLYFLQKQYQEIFYIYIFYRQNTSWQGEVIWKRNRQRRYFRSVLELLYLLDSAFQPGQGRSSEAGRNTTGTG